MGTLGLIMIVVFLLILLRFVGKILKNLVLLVLFVIGSAIAVWYFVPEDKLKEIVGTEYYEMGVAIVKPWIDKVEKVVKDGLDEVEKTVKEKTDSTLNE